VTWTLVLLLGLGAYAFKALGLVVIGDRRLPAVLERCIGLIPAALIGAIIVKDTLTVGRHIQLDARAAGIATAFVLAWRKAPFLAIVLSACAVTAILRAL
jgi:branched-subunit amino acid transport protein